MNIAISEHAYHKFLVAAQARGTTPEAFVESLAEQLPEGYAHDEDAFYRAPGVDDARRQRIDELWQRNCPTNLTGSHKSSAHVQIRAHAGEPGNSASLTSMRPRDCAKVVKPWSRGR